MSHCDCSECPKKECKKCPRKECKELEIKHYNPFSYIDENGKNVYVIELIIENLLDETIRDFCIADGLIASGDFELLEVKVDQGCVVTVNDSTPCKLGKII